MMGQGDRTERLLEAGLALSSELSLSAMLQRIVDLAVDLTGARYGALGVLGPDGTITQFITTGVTEEQRVAIGHIPIGRGILGVLIHDATPLRMPDIAADPRSVGFPANHPPMRTLLCWVKARVGLQEAVELAGDVADQAASDLAVGLALCPPALGIGAGRWVITQPG